MLKALILIVLTVCYIMIKNYLEGRLLKEYENSDEFCLSSLAVARKCSTYDIFRTVAQDWGFSDAKVEDDFRRYLRTGDIPHYISSYVRKHIHDTDRRYGSMVHPGGSLPRSWSA
ncbi:hypothetical protein D3OALGA1CA_5588 [Olavius algarvensis associated proteobacterium Delta 3]|nr:hypothetical protein D3OALGB2SA_5399 [Olavius algarvensis associated proteobacterium Delta 3]CAB5168874.1 hypothetical protein D3OALGA1CA_5588 [Olavius algarvensis associated proteobacterium Delta 3]